MNSLSQSLTKTSSEEQASILDFTWFQSNTFLPSGGADYAHHITNGTPGFSDHPTALQTMYIYSTSWTSSSQYRDQFYAFNCNLTKIAFHS